MAIKAITRNGESGGFRLVLEKVLSFDLPNLDHIMNPRPKPTKTPEVRDSINSIIWVADEICEDFCGGQYFESKMIDYLSAKKVANERGVSSRGARKTTRPESPDYPDHPP